HGWVGPFRWWSIPSILRTQPRGGAPWHAARTKCPVYCLATVASQSGLNCLFLGFQRRILVRIGSARRGLRRYGDPAAWPNESLEPDALGRTAKPTRRHSCHTCPSPAGKNVSG